MRILLTNHFPFQGAGTGTSTNDLAVGLLNAGHDVHCLIVDFQRESQELVPVRRIVCNPDDPTADLHFNLPSFTTHPNSHTTFFDLSDEQISEYREVLRQVIDAEVTAFDPQIVHCQHVWVQACLVLETGVPYVASVQATDLDGYRRDERFHLWAEQSAENASRLVVDGHWLAEDVQTLFDVEPERIMVRPPAVNHALYQGQRPSREAILAKLNVPADDGPLIVYGGKLVDSQGIDVLLQAAAKYESQLDGAVTVIAGDGPQFMELENLARKLKLRRTFFVGERDRFDCAALYGTADLVVVPCRKHPFEVVWLEAMASGTPVLGSDHCGLIETVSDEVGGLFPGGNSAALAERVVAAIREDWKTHKGLAASKYVADHHNINDWVQQIAELYEQVLDERFA